MTETDFCFLFDNLLLPQFGISHLEKYELSGVLNVVSVQSLRFIVKEAVCSQCGYHVHDEVKRTISGRTIRVISAIRGENKKEGVSVHLVHPLFLYKSFAVSEKVRTFAVWKVKWLIGWHI